MGLFGGGNNKSEIYERNTIIAGLKVDIDTLTEKITKLTDELAEERADNESLKDDVAILNTENKGLSENLSKLRNDYAELELKYKALSETAVGSVAETAEGLKKN